MRNTPHTNHIQETHMGLLAEKLRESLTHLRNKENQLQQDTEDLLTEIRELTHNLDTLLEDN